MRICGTHRHFATISLEGIPRCVESTSQDYLLRNVGKLLVPVLTNFYLYYNCNRQCPFSNLVVIMKIVKFLLVIMLKLIQ